MVNNILIEVLGTIAQQERETTRQRQAEGIAAARARGVQLGRPKKKVPDDFGDLMEKWEAKTLEMPELLETCGISKRTFYRRLREYQAAKPKISEVPKCLLYVTNPA